MTILFKDLRFSLCFFGWFCFLSIGQIWFFEQLCKRRRSRWENHICLLDTHCRKRQCWTNKAS